jgi:signal transduction histidine kinase/ActR/RegA family two-component response regulator
MTALGISGEVAPEEPQRRARRTLELSLDAQVALLPQALAVFAVTLPIFVWVSSFARDAAFMAASFAIFAINWAVFYIVVNWLEGRSGNALSDRLRVQIGSGLLWALAVMQIAAFANGAGAAREPILMAAAAAAVICLFFTAPLLPALLIVGPVAMAGPLYALFASPSTRDQAGLVWGAFALAFLLTLILNQTLRRQFALAADRELLNEAAEAARTRSDKLARSKSDLLETLSHEIRNGLTGVAHVLAAAAGQNARAAPSREQLAAALAAAEDLIMVLDATLDSDTAEGGRLIVTSSRFDAAALVREVVAQARQQASRRELGFSVYIEPELETEGGAAVGDALRVRQILANLVGNALKYTVRGQVEVRLERRGSALLEIAVADTGPGLTPEELEAAFQPFHRVGRTGAGVAGAGLGLSLSRQLAALMGARIAARSAVGVGSCFTLELPFDADAAPIAAPSEVHELQLGGGRRLKVLIAEEDPLSAALLRTILEQLGHQVAHAKNGRRALDLAGAVGFDLVMLAARMSEMDGFDTARALRADNGPLAATPLVAVIDGEADEAQAWTAAGVEAVIRKPLSVTAVARALAAAGPRQTGYAGRTAA